MSDEKALSVQDMVMLFNYATRLVAIEPNEEQIFERSVEALFVLADKQAVSLYLKTEEGDTLRLEGALQGTAYRSDKIRVPFKGTPFERVITGKQYGSYPLREDPARHLLLPAYEPEPSGRSCLCLPMAGSANDIIGTVTIEKDPSREWSIAQIQMFISFTTVIAISIENSRLYRLATIDGLTRLFVRSFFEIRLTQEIARQKRNGGALAVFLADIDGFKEINDTYGHGQGDTVLREFGAILQRTTRKGVDIPCRYGGDEFVILIIGAKPDDAVHLADRIREACATHLFPFEGAEPPKVTISGGLAFVEPGEEEGLKEIVERADRMLYRAKGSGRNQICW